LKTSINNLASQELRRRIHEIESRAGNLNIERSYPQLQNPGFELEEGGGRIIGWYPVIGSAELVQNNPHSGAQALRLKSEDATGVVVQSNLFPTPSTGQLMVSLYLRFMQQEENSQLQIVVLDQNNGRRYRRYAVLSKQQIAGTDWSHYEFPLDDVPFGQSEQLRLQFHLVGKAEVLVDDVQLYDLRFDDARRRALLKRIFAANEALERGQMIDCLRMVDDYWSRYLVEYVPPTESVEFQATKQPQATEIPKDGDIPKEKSGIGSRLRGWVPSIWR